MDQFLNMRGVERARAGISLGTQRADREGIRKAVAAKLENSAYSDNARRLAVDIARYQSGHMVIELIEQWLG